MRFQEVFNLVNRYYVEPPDTEKLIEGAIHGMLGELDPHTVYIPEKKLQKVNERFEGSFEGIGIEFIILNKVLTVVSPIVGGPSEAVGLLPGDRIVEIEGESTYGITEDEVQEKLRGPKGSKVDVTIRRPGEEDTFEVTITRDTIPIYSVMAAFLLQDNKTGYIYLGRFSKTTAEEVENALKKLESQGMQQLIFDLRGNSGGYLDQAVKVVNKFIPGRYRVVYTKGRIPQMDEDFYSTDSGTHDMYPVVVMIDHGSASASEIVAGAVQDLDRGLVVGQTSFGKGLVQNQINLHDGGAIRLTIARYYTPSGRLIQRPYENGLADYYQEAYSDDTERNKPDSTKKYVTLAGRTVYGGGGIIPDSILTSGRITRFTYNLRRKRLFFEFGSTYGPELEEQFDGFKAFNTQFRIDDRNIEQLKALMKKHDLEFNAEAFEKDEDYIKLLMKAEVARHLWDSEHYYRIRVTGDDEVETALNAMSLARKVKQLHSWQGSDSQ
ncbi:MAG: S41 family peptidase [candidate division KSB1 bacterium]|nr:S41 family peptidase [candidate division KSB1 bacterium]